MAVLPNHARAAIDIAKLPSYSMNPNNAGNRGKWVGFNRLGFDTSTASGRDSGAQVLIQALLAELETAEAIESRKVRVPERRFEVRINITGPNGRTGILHTVWLLTHDNAAPRLITNWAEVTKAGSNR